MFLKFIKLRFKLTNETDFSAIPINDIPISEIQKIKLEDIHAFISYMATTLHSKPATRARKCSSIRIFFKYLSQKEKLIENNPAQNLETPKKDKRMPKYLSLDESKKLLSITSNDSDNRNEKRDYAIITIFLNCGIMMITKNKIIYFQEAYMKKAKKILLVLMSAVLMIECCGCGIFISERKLKKVLENALEEKYDEEFECFDVWSNRGDSYWGVCAPEKNHDIRFEALFLSDGKISEITYEGYYAACVAEQIEEDVQNELENVFNDFYLHSYMYI